MENAVSIVKDKTSSRDLKDTVSQALTMINFHPDNPVKTVIIKPNLCYYWGSSTGNTTDPMLVAAIIDYVREKYGKQVNIKIAEADASAMRTKYAFSVLGYKRLAAAKNVELVNLSEDELKEFQIKVKNCDLSFKIPQLLLNADLFINVPKLKVMKATTITCAMKNIFGCIGYRRKVKYHRVLAEAIVGVNKILHPHLTIVDGLIALGRHPVRLDLILAGVDPFSVDWTASELMGFNPSKIKFLKLAIEEGIGNPKSVMQKGENPESFSKVFPKPSLASSNHIWRVQSALLKAYKKLSGDIVPPALEE